MNKQKRRSNIIRDLNSRRQFLQRSSSYVAGLIAAGSIPLNVLFAF